MQVESTDLTPLLDLDKAPKKLFDVELTPAQQTDYCLGKEIFLKDMNIGGQSKDGKVKLFKDPKGVLQHKMDYRKDNLEIPKSIFDKVLSEDEVKKLHKGEDVELNTKNGKYFIKIDKELNSVVVRSEKEISSMPQIGEYKLSSQEQKDLLEGKRMETKVFKGKDGYFTANVELSKDKKGLVFTNAKLVSSVDAELLIDRYNKPKEFDKTTEILSASSIAAVGKEAITKPEEKMNTKENNIKDPVLTINNEFYKENNFVSIDRWEKINAEADGSKEIIYIATDKDKNLYVSEDLATLDNLTGTIKGEHKGPIEFVKVEDENTLRAKLDTMSVKNETNIDQNLKFDAYKDNLIYTAHYSKIVPDRDTFDRIENIYIAKDNNNNLFIAHDKSSDQDNLQGPGIWKKADSLQVELAIANCQIEKYEITGNTKENLNDRYKDVTKTKKTLDVEIWSVTPTSTTYDNSYTAIICTDEKNNKYITRDMENESKYGLEGDKVKVERASHEPVEHEWSKMSESQYQSFVSKNDIMDRIELQIDMTKNIFVGLDKHGTEMKMETPTKAKPELLKDKTVEKKVNKTPDQGMSM